MTSAQPNKRLQAALALHRAGRLDDALARYLQILTVTPRSFDAAHLGGMIALQQGKAAAARELLERAHALAPHHAVCAMHLALAFSKSGRHEEAEIRLRRLLEPNPNWAEAWDNLGNTLQLRGRLSEAIDAYRRSVAVQPNYAAGWCNLGLALLFADRAEEGLACQERARKADPDYARAHHGRGLALQHLHRIPEAVKAYGMALAADPGNLETRSYRLMALHYLSDVARDRLFAEHVAFGKAAAAASVRSRPASPAARDASAAAVETADQRLRVAFLSPDLRTHSIAYFLEPLLQHLDPKAFEIVLYHDHFQVDETSVRLQKNAALWRNLVGLPIAEAEQQIRSDRPHILVDLAGHTGLNRLPLFARRLAPVQVTYLGYPDTTGLAAMDYRLVDAITDPTGEADAHCVEKLIRFAPTAWSYAPPDSAPPPARAPGEGTVFGCFNTAAKVSDELLQGWAALLAQVPASRLLLKAAGLGGGAGASLLRRLRDAGIAAERVTMLGRTRGTAEHLALYAQVDIALDTYPYHGTTTTCEALWMGIPVVTLAGDRHASRVGARLLTAVGHPEWIAQTWAEYVSIAAALAQRTDRGQGSRLRSHMAQSPLMDHAGQAARFGDALRRCWQNRLENEEREVA